MHRRTLLLALPALAACAADPPPPADGNGQVRLPPEAGWLLLDPDRLAASHIGATLTAPSRQRGNPVAQARALGFYEFTTVALSGPRWTRLDPLAVPNLRRGREEMRAAHGIRADAPAQVVLESFFLAGAALSVGDRDGAIRSFPPGILTVPGEQLVALLDAPPPMPQVVRASAQAARAIDATDGGAGGWRRL